MTDWIDQNFAIGARSKATPKTRKPPKDSKKSQKITKKNTPTDAGKIREKKCKPSASQKDWEPLSIEGPKLMERISNRMKANYTRKHKTTNEAVIAPLLPNF
jgi:hypothetical protein